MDMEEEIKIQEAEVLDEKENPVLEIIEPEAKIKTVGEVTTNIAEVKKQALAMNEYYSKLIVTDDNLNDAKDEKANINKAKDKIAEYRKSIVSEFKKPIDLFEKLAKETEAILKETYDMINTQCNAYDERKKDEAKETLKRYFEEYKATKNLGFTQYEEMNQSVGLSDISDKGSVAKKKYKEIDEFIDNIVKDVDTIEAMDNAEEILVEYMKDRNLARSIKEVADRQKIINKIVENKATVVQAVVEEPKVILSAPVAQAAIQEESEELCEAVFKVKTSYENITELVKFMKTKGIEYESIE
ncbi:MAG TPA: hypothetical protein DCE23_04295 [Firmicutes bacterium]|nr:hypothetical protein [Bacillota bacterium]